jgi:hypothetical protein
MLIASGLLALLIGAALAALLSSVADLGALERPRGGPRRCWRRDPAAARTVDATNAGRRCMDTIRAKFDRFWRPNGPPSPRAIGLGESILLIALFAGYLTRAIVQPVRRGPGVAARAGRGGFTALPGGEPSSRSTCRSRIVLPASRHTKMPARQEP